MSSTTQAAWIKVWDPVVRYGHWALAAAFAIADLSAEDEGGEADLLHVWSGYVVGIVVAVRVIWGLIGTRHARFTDFAYGPMSALQYLNDLMRGRARRHIGHSPAGAAMIFALLICLAGTVWTGLVAYGDSGKGPLANAGSVVTPQAYADEREGRSERSGGGRRNGGESAVGELHAVFANITLGLVVLHILGVGLASVVHRENLVGSMISGRKRPADQG